MDEEEAKLAAGIFAEHNRTERVASASSRKAGGVVNMMKSTGEECAEPGQEFSEQVEKITSAAQVKYEDLKGSEKRAVNDQAANIARMKTNLTTQLTVESQLSSPNQINRRVTAPSPVKKWNH